jgi:catechol 2,3-dioxygenase-like lactoylglutathione lyase family enzyme
MFSHAMVGSNDIERSRRFYDATFTAIGGEPGITDAAGRLVYRHNGGTFMVSKPIDGKPATSGNGSTLGIKMADAGQADAWHAAGVANGGTSIEDPPGVRLSPTGVSYYLAYLRDPDGNKLCGLHRPEQ